MRVHVSVDEAYAQYWFGKAIIYLGLVVSHNDQFPGMDLMFLQQAFLQGLYEKLEAFIRVSQVPPSGHKDRGAWNLRPSDLKSGTFGPGNLILVAFLMPLPFLRFHS